jgi:hypothetical protein
MAFSAPRFRSFSVSQAYHFALRRRCRAPLTARQLVERPQAHLLSIDAGKIDAFARLMNAKSTPSKSMTRPPGSVLAYTSDVLKQRRIVALVDVPNRASHALFRRCGFREIGAGQGPLYRAIAYERTT